MKFLKIALISMILITSISAQQNLIKKTVINTNSGYTKFSATAYCLKGKTASGIKTRSGIVAADTRVFKLGSSISILGIGTFLVSDTGGAIKGNKLDIWVPSCRQAIIFGRKTVLVKKN